jgi:hypothetical protein
MAKVWVGPDKGIIPTDNYHETLTEMNISNIHDHCAGGRSKSLVLAFHLERELIPTHRKLP